MCPEGEKRNNLAICELNQVTKEKNHNENVETLHSADC